MLEDLKQKIMAHPRGTALVGIALAVLIVVVDQLTKAWIMYGINLPLHESVEVWPFFSLTMVRNTGISYGLLNSGGIMRWALAVFQVSAAIALVVWITRNRDLVLNLALGLIAGGAFGNAIDRIRLGYVIDFLDFSKIYFKWVFNVADSAITIGVLVMLYHFYLAKPKADPLEGEPKQP